MFKKLLSALTVMLFVFGMNVSAQNLQKANLGKVMPKFAGNNVVTSKIDDLAADEAWIGYWDGVVNDETALVGVQAIPATYGCAIKYPEGQGLISGKTIEGIKFSFPDSRNIDNVKVFIATELPNTAEEANITYMDVKNVTCLENQEDPFNEVRFANPYVVDSSKPVYIGYFFDVTGGGGSAEKFPLLIQKGKDMKDAMLMRVQAGTNTQEWIDLYGQGFGVYAMQILVKGTFEDNAAAIAEDLGKVIGVKDSFDLPIVVENVGSKGIESVTVEVDVNGIKTEVESKPAAPIKGIGTKYAFIAKIATPATIGTYDYTVKITKVNGQPLSKESVGKGQMMLLSRVAQHRVFYEEFTGMWCGFCPRGMVAIEKIKNIFGDKVIVAAAHSGDALSCSEYNKIINDISGGSFPMACLDRTMAGDPYNGSNNTKFGVKNDIEELMAQIPVAEVFSKPFLDGDILTANADVNFLFTGDASDYAIGYVLTHDGMQNERWSQSNYMSGDASWISVDPLFEPWVKADKKVKGVVFGEVVIGAKGMEAGVAGSIPASVTAETPVSHSVEFDLKKYKKIQDRDKLNLIVVLFNTKTGAIVNSAIMSVKDGTAGIEEIEGEDSNVVETARYTIDGRRINQPEAGINIVKYSDGTIKKVIVK